MGEHRSFSYLPACLLVGLVMGLARPSTALAEFVTVGLKAGGEVTGLLLDEAVGDHLTVDVGYGRPIRVVGANVAWVRRNVPPPVRPQWQRTAASLPAPRPRSATADRATVQLRRGTQITGSLLEYVPGDHVTVGHDEGQTTRVPASEIASVEIQSGPAARAKSTALAAAPMSTSAASPADSPEPWQQPMTAGPAVPLTAASQAAAVQALMNERADWQGRNTGVAAPLILTALGVLALGGGAALQGVYSDQHEEVLNTASIGTLIAGGALLGTGIVLWLVRTSSRRQETELRRIDDQLRFYGVQASLKPWFTPKSSTQGGAAGGLTLSLKL